MAYPWEIPTYQNDPWKWFQAGMVGEHGQGGYRALYSQAQDEGGPFAGMDVTEKTVDELIEFADPSGDYAQYVARTRKDEPGVVGTPMGNYQIVGKTLKGLKDDLGLTGNELFDEDLQDKLGKKLALDVGLGAFAAGQIDKATFEKRAKETWRGWKDPTAGGIKMAQRDNPDQTGIPPTPVPPILNPDQGAGQPGAMGGMWNDNRNPPGSLLSRIFGGGADQRDKFDFSQGLATVGETLSALGQRRTYNPEVNARFDARRGANRTAEWLERTGRPDMAEAIRSGQMTAAQAMTQMAQAQPKPLAAERLYERAKAEGFQGTFMDFLKARSGGVNVNFPQIGTIPAGYEVTKSDDGAWRMQPIPGGPADRAEAKEKAKAAQTEKMVQRQANVVLQDIDRIIETAPEWTVGFTGSILGAVPGTKAHDIRKTLDTIKANVGFDKLQAMRAASPTGGALGQVSDLENRLLQSTLGSLEQSQSAEQFMFNLKRLRELYLDIIHGPGERPEAPVSDDDESGERDFDLEFDPETGVIK